MTKHTQGPWFIWKERAMQEEGMDKDEIESELLERDDFDVMGGNPVGEVTRSRIRGCKTIVSLDAYDFGDDEEEGRIVALANARLIAAAPKLLEALKWHLDALDLGDVAFYERHGFNASEVMPRTRAIVKKAEGEQQ
jgi:hypothetical protein